MSGGQGRGRAQLSLLKVYAVSSEHFFCPPILSIHFGCEMFWNDLLTRGLAQHIVCLVFGHMAQENISAYFRCIPSLQSLGCGFPVSFEFPPLPGKPSSVCRATEFALTKPKIS